VDLRTCGGYFADRRPQLGPQNTHWLVRRSASPQNTRGRTMLRWTFRLSDAIREGFCDILREIDLAAWKVLYAER